MILSIEMTESASEINPNIEPRPIVDGVINGDIMIVDPHRLEFVLPWGADVSRWCDPSTGTMNENILQNPRSNELPILEFPSARINRISQLKQFVAKPFTGKLQSLLAK